MNRNRSSVFSARANSQHPLVLACAAGLLALGLAGSALGASLITGGQGGTGGNGGNGGNSGNGGGGGALMNSNVSGVGGAGGLGGVGGSSSNAAGGAGGAGGAVGNSLLVNSTVTIATSGSNGGNGNYGTNGGGGGGGGGDGIYAATGITVTNQSTITGGHGGYGPQGFSNGGGGGGGGNGLAGNSLSIVNSAGATITGGIGGNGYGYPGSYVAGDSYGGGGGGGNGVTGANLTISNSGTISGGAGGTGSNLGTAGDAILFTGGATNTLNLLTGSTITGNIELAGAKAYIDPQNTGLTLSSNIVLDSNISAVAVNNNSDSLTVSGVISGPGSLYVYGTLPNKTIITSVNTFTGGSTVQLSGDLQVDGSINDVTVNGGILGGTGTVGNITLNSSGAIAPGDSPGTLNGASLTWNGGGAFDFQLGATNSTTDTDLLALTGNLGKGGAGTWVFHFSDGNGKPTLGTTYTLITFGSNDGFSAGDFSYDYTGADPSLVGSFAVTANSVTFTTTATPVTLQSFEVD